MAAIRSGLSQTRIANVRPPRMSARCTPWMELSLGWTTRSQVVRDLVLIELLGGKAQIHRPRSDCRRSPAR